MLIKIRPRTKAQDFEQPNSDYMNQSQNQLIQPPLSGNVEDLGFRSGEHFFVPELINNSSNNLQKVIVENQSCQNVVVQLNASTFKKVKKYIETPQIMQIVQNNENYNNEDNRTSCRICLEEDQIINFITPCLCKGTMRFVHLDCLKTWLLKKQSIDLIRQNKINCELCKSPFQCEVEVKTHYMFSLLLNLPKQQQFCLLFFFSASLLLLCLGVFLITILTKNQDNFLPIIIGVCISFISSIVIIWLLSVMVFDIIKMEVVSKWIIQSLSNNSHKGSAHAQKSMNRRRVNSLPIFNNIQQVQQIQLHKQQSAFIKISKIMPLK